MLRLEKWTSLPMTLCDVNAHYGTIRDDVTIEKYYYYLLFSRLPCYG
jgi:hypothetical protein